MRLLIIKCSFYFMLMATALYLYYSFYYKPTISPRSDKLQHNLIQSRLKSYELNYRNLNFNKDGDDILSFIHIQKTGGTTLEKHLVFNIKDSNCKCAKAKKPLCLCYRKDLVEIWLVCRYIQPSWPCGLHPDFSTTTECTPSFINSMYTKRQRRYFYATLLREPLHRFLSEYRHVQRGASWGSASSLCRGTLFVSQVKKCYQGNIWIDLTMNDFLNCKNNLAFNRQTWMLSNISDVSCDPSKLFYEKNGRKKLLAIAKLNLASMAYFGLLEFPTESQYVFEKTFNMEFIEPFQLWNVSYAAAYLTSFNISKENLEKINYLNRLDKELYEYAKHILFERFAYFVSKYGHPTYRKPSANGRFNLNKIKAEKMQLNLPKSKEKQELLRKKREEYYLSLHTTKKTFTE